MMADKLTPSKYENSGNSLNNVEDKLTPFKHGNVENSSNKVQPTNHFEKFR